MLAAFALWADANIAAGPLSPADRQRIAAVCSRIRFPDVPPDVLLNYWAAFKWLQLYDSGKKLLLRAVGPQPTLLPQLGLQEGCCACTMTNLKSELKASR